MKITRLYRSINIKVFSRKKLVTTICVNFPPSTMSPELEVNKIWFADSTLEEINAFNKNTIISHLDIQITEQTPHSLSASMPVDERTFQPYRLLHGGASCVLAESLGSIAANMTLDPNQFVAVGQHIEATHLRPATSGRVKGIAKNVHLGKTSQLWKIEIYNEDNKLICDSKILMAIIKKQK